MALGPLLDLALSLRERERASADFGLWTDLIRGGNERPTHFKPWAKTIHSRLDTLEGRRGQKISSTIIWIDGDA